MKLRNTTFLYIFILVLFFSINSQAQSARALKTDSIQAKIKFINKYLFEDNSWSVSDSLFKKNVSELIHFAEKQRLDSITGKVAVFKDSQDEIISRPPFLVSDTLDIEGFIPCHVVRKMVAELRNSVTEEFMENDLQVPVELLTGIEDKVKTIPQEEGMRLFTDSIYRLPDSLLFLDAIPDSMVQTAEDFQRILKLDSLRDAIVEKHRVRYNDSIITVYRDSILSGYRNDALEALLEKRIRQYTDSINHHNQKLVVQYNREITKEVNDTLKTAISSLIHYVNSIDTVDIRIANLFDESTGLTLGDKSQQFGRLWLKNKQNDSISILITNPDKRSLKLLVDDNVTFSHISQKQSKDIKIIGKRPENKLLHLSDQYKVFTPWSLSGKGNLGLTQTYLSNWKAGGQSAVQLLLVLKGAADYTSADENIKWENSLEVRNGWIQYGKDDDGNKYEPHKNADKFKIVSRIGLSAFKKWYYSAEVDFQTQFYNGYNYPKSSNPDPVSAFMAPSKILFKLGFDYKPNNNLSLFISPITSKTVTVLDTIKIDKSNYSIPEGKRTLWTPGLNAEISYKTKFASNITYETSCETFINYTSPLKKFDFEWENQIDIKLNDYINVQFLLHFLYDDDVLFSVTDSEGNVSKETRLQVKELITVGVTYSLGKTYKRARKVRRTVNLR